MKYLSAVLIITIASVVNGAEISREFLAAQLVEDATSRVDSISAPAGFCASPSVTAVHFSDLLKKRRAMTVKDESGVTQSLSILSTKEANELQAYVNGDQTLVAKFTEDGCEQRAIETGRILRTQGVRAGIISAFPGGFQESGRFKADFPGAVPGTLWRHHYAVTIAVQEKGQTVMKVIDPVFSKTPLTKAQWVRKLQARSTADNPVEIYLTADQSFDENAAEKANAQLRFYRDTQKKRDNL